MNIFNELLIFLNEKEITYEKDVSMKTLTTFKIGGQSKFVCFPQNIEKFRILIEFLKEKKIKYSFLGNGSNILVLDEGYLGVFISTKNLNKIKILNNSMVYCESGVNLVRLCKFLKENFFSGMEPLFGIPGSLGGAIYMNAGAYGAEIKDFVILVSYIDEGNNLKELNLKDIYFSYRYSIFQKTENFIVSAVLKLKKGDKSEIEKNMNLYIKKRIEKQPLKFPNAGSIFKRPDGFFAAKLIEESGLKGFRIGDAKVSEKHCGFIINVGDARAKDVEKVIEKIKETVKIKKGIDLKTEIKIIG